MPSFYADQNFLNVTYALDIAIEEHFASYLFDGDLSRIVYSSDSFALRRRAQNEDMNNLNLPFLNYKLDDFDFSQQTWWNNKLFSRGVFIDEIGAAVRLSPVSLQYEATFWCHRDDEMRFAYTELRFDADSKTTVTGEIEIKNKIVPFPGQLGFTGLDFDPQYEESDWLERNKIHSISMDFEVITWIMKTNENITIPDTVILNFLSHHDVDLTEVSHSETATLLIDHFNETVEET